MSLELISSQFTEETLQKIVVKAGAKLLKSWAFAEGSASKKGDSYLSELFKLDITGVCEDGKEIAIYVIIKSTPKSIGRSLSFRSADFFRNEIHFYETVLKAFEDFQAEKPNVKRPFLDFPKCYASHCDGRNDFLALENMNPIGFATVPRQFTMDMKVCRLIMETLGRFHGLSFVIRDQKPELFNKLTSVLEETYYAPKLKSWYNNFMKSQIMVATDAVSKEYGGTIIEEKMRKFIIDGDLYDKMAKMTHTRNEYSVIGHGDTWTPNFLINFESKDDQQVPVAAKIIDFQLARYASPVIDISFFIYSCTSQEIREKHFDELIRYYHESCLELIRDFGSDPEKLFPMSALQAELKLFARFGVGMGIESLPFSMMDDSETAEMNIPDDKAVPIETVWVLKPIAVPEKRRRLAEIFKHATECGFLD